MMKRFLVTLSLATGCSSVESQPELDPKPVPVSTSTKLTLPDHRPNTTQTSNQSNGVHRLESSDFSQRMKTAIQSSQNLRVNATDPMGEGNGFFDSDPRIVDDTVDCMTWVQWVLALAYAGPNENPQPWLDAIRYYGSNIGFDTRKHYVDRWLTLEPGPLVPIQSEGLAVENERIQLALQKFQQHHQYPCELYQSELNHIRLDVIPQHHLLDTIQNLAPGFYILFGIATDHYLSMYGTESGPMAQVHPAILEITKLETWIHHASTALEQVASVTPDEWLDGNRRLHRASTIYSLDPSWTLPLDHSSSDVLSECSVR